MVENLSKIIDEKYLEYKDKLPISLFGGLAGLAIYYFYMGKYSRRNEYISCGNEILDNIILQINGGLINTPKVVHSYSYGLAGVAFTFSHLKQNGFIDFDIEGSFQILDDFFITTSQNDYQNEVSDFLHGPIGVLYYFSKRLPNSDMLTKIDFLVELFLNNVIDDGKTIKIRNTIIEQNLNEFDMGIAHGQSGVLMVFSELYQNGYKSDKIMSIIRKLSTYILSTEESNLLATQGNSCFPSSVNEMYPLRSAENYKNYRSRLAWCYGDLSIALALHKAGTVIDDSTLIKKSIQIAMNTTKRENISETDVKDIYFCHGASGVAYIYNFFYYNSGIQDFADRHIFWKKKCEEYFQSLESSKIGVNEALNFLEGLPGVVLALMATKDRTLQSWDNCFLL